MPGPSESSERTEHTARIASALRCVAGLQPEEEDTMDTTGAAGANHNEALRGFFSRLVRGR